MASRKTLILVAAVLIGAVAAFGTLNYVKGVQNSSAAEEETVQVLVARQAIPKGTSADEAFAAGLLTAAERRRVDVPANPVRRNAEIEGQVAAVDLGGGEIITTSMFVGTTDLSGSKSASIDKGNVAITVQFSPTAVSLVQPGDRINILVRTCPPPMPGQAAECSLVSSGLSLTAAAVVQKPATYAFQNVKVIAVDRNHADVPETSPAPQFALKPSTSVIGPNEAISLPWQSEDVSARGELAVVIGRLCRDVPADRVPEVVFGYTCANDVTARDVAAIEGQRGQALAYDTFCPLGPWIETDLEVDDLPVELGIDDLVVSSWSTSQMIRDVTDLVVAVSAVMTLLPGDVILTGSGSSGRALAEGDLVRVRIPGIGTLRNPVIDRV